MSGRLPGMYDYKTEKPKVMTEEGQRAVCEALLEAQHLAKGNGLIPHELLSVRVSGPNSFFAAAVIERLVEMSYIARVDNGDASTPRSAWIYRWIARSRS